MNEELDPYELENLDNAFWFSEILRFLWEVNSLEDGPDDAFRIYKDLPVEAHDDLIMFLFGNMIASNITLKKMIDIMKGE